MCMLVEVLSCIGGHTWATQGVCYAGCKPTSGARHRLQVVLVMYIFFFCVFFFCQWVFSHNLEDEISSEEGEM